MIWGENPLFLETSISFLAGSTFNEGEWDGWHPQGNGFESLWPWPTVGASEIPSNHLGCKKNGKQWDKLPTSTGAGFLPSAVWLIWKLFPANSCDIFVMSQASLSGEELFPEVGTKKMISGGFEVLKNTLESTRSNGVGVGSTMNVESFFISRQAYTVIIHICQVGCSSVWWASNHMI